MTLLIVIKWELLFIFYIKFKQHTNSYDTWCIYKQQTLAWSFLQSLLREAIVYFHFKKIKNDRIYMILPPSASDERIIAIFSMWRHTAISYTDLKRETVEVFLWPKFH